MDKLCLEMNDKELVKSLQNVLDNKNKTIERLKQEIEKLKNGVAYRYLQEDFNEFKHHTIICLWSKKELKTYDDYCKKHGGNNIVIRQYNTGIGIITELNYVNRAGDLMGEWEDITDVSVW